MASIRINVYKDILKSLPKYVTIQKGKWNQNQYVVQNKNNLIEDIQTILSIEEYPGDMYFSNYKYHKKLLFNKVVKRDPKYKLFTQAVHFENCNLKNITINDIHVRGGYFMNCNLENSLFNRGWFHDFGLFDCNLQNSTFTPLKI